MLSSKPTIAVFSAFAGNDAVWQSMLDTNLREDCGSGICSAVRRNELVSVMEMQLCVVSVGISMHELRERHFMEGLIGISQAAVD